MKITNEQQTIIQSAIAGNNIAIKAYAGCGKAQPSYCKIQVPSGTVTMGEIEVGDSIFRKDGSIGSVVGKYPQGTIPTYKVSFRDGSHTYCNEEHLWNIEVLDARHKKRHGITYTTVTLAHMMSKGIVRPSGDFRWKIPLTSAVNYEAKHYYIHPYLLGLLIGDGSLLTSPPRLSVGHNEFELIDELIAFMPEGFSFSERFTSDNCKQLSIYDVKESAGRRPNKIMEEIIALDLVKYSHEKHVPEKYLLGSIEQRYWLLRGLMDSDGSCQKNRTSFCSTSPRLISGVKRLVQSLGGIAIESAITHTEAEHPVFTLNIKTMECPFHVRSKASKWTFSWKNPPSRFITSVERVEDTEQYCIAVDAPDNLYLTDEFIVTHNTQTLRLIAQEAQKTALCLAFNKSIADEMQQAMLSDGSAWVTCQTINSLAWRAVVKSSNSKFGKKLEAGLSLNDIKKYVHDFKELPKDERVEALLELKYLVTSFCNSSYDSFLDLLYSKSDIDMPTLHRCDKYWDILTDENHPAGISHDVYVKLFQLSKPKLAFDVIMVDEFQDLNECNLDIIYSQKQYGTQLIVVGDTNQEIFGFRSSVTAFKTLPSYFKELRLSESFRFTPEIAEICTKLVKINGEDVPVIGRNSYRSSEQVAYICRTNLTVFQLAFSMLSSRKKVHLIADLKPLSNQLYHIADLMCGKQPKFPNKELSQYEVKEDLYVAAKKQQELATLINLTKLLMNNGGVWKCLEKLKKETVPLADAEVVIATCHKLKGLGFDSVVVMEDFIYLREDEDLSLIPSKLADGQTLELLYVAISRAKYSVELPDLVQYVINNADNIRPNYLENKQ